PLQACALLESGARRPARAEELLVLGLAREALGDHEMAADGFRRAAAARPRFAPALERLGGLPGPPGGVAGGRPAALDPLKAGAVDAALPLAESYAREGKHEAASQLLGGALGADPESPALWTALAESLARERKDREAMDAFENALRFSPAEPRAARGS